MGTYVPRTHVPIEPIAPIPDPPVRLGRKERGAFFTPLPIADYLAEWAVRSPSARVLDPTCGEAVFLQAAGRRLLDLGARVRVGADQLFGVDLHATSLRKARTILADDGLDATFLEDDFFNVYTPGQLGASLPPMDAVIGNPPFVRYQEQVGGGRDIALRAALMQDVRLSGLSSSWAPLLVHAAAFLKPEGRLAMVLPAELLTVKYAQPIREWLRQRFAAVHIYLFERLQFADALEKVVLLTAVGSGPGSGAFALHYVEDAADLVLYDARDAFPVTPGGSGKWTDLLLTPSQRATFEQVRADHFVPLGSLASVELGSVTGANWFFALSESTRQEYNIGRKHLSRIVPPGSRHLKGLSFAAEEWDSLRDDDRPVWLLTPKPNAETADADLASYIDFGRTNGVPDGYKVSIRDPWWCSPMVPPPDYFFTYMSHRHPRFVRNEAGVSLLNSMHGVRMSEKLDDETRDALPLVMLNSFTALGAELSGRSYGGGLLKLEPREAAELPIPSKHALGVASRSLAGRIDELEARFREGASHEVVEAVDQALLRGALGLSEENVDSVRAGLRTLRLRRNGDP